MNNLIENVQYWELIDKWIQHINVESFAEYSVLKITGYYYFSCTYQKYKNSTEKYGGYMYLIQIDGITIEEWIADSKEMIK